VISGTTAMPIGMRTDREPSWTSPWPQRPPSLGQAQEAAELRWFRDDVNTDRASSLPSRVGCPWITTAGRRPPTSYTGGSGGFPRWQIGTRVKCAWAEPG